VGITLCLEDSFKLRQATHIAVYEARWQQRAIDNFPRRPLTVSHSPPRGSYLGCQLLIRTVCIRSLRNVARFLRVGASFIPRPLIQNLLVAASPSAGYGGPKSQRDQ